MMSGDMPDWNWPEVLARRDFWRLYCRSDEPLDDETLPRELFFAGMLDTIEPAADEESLAIVASLPEGIARTMVLKQLALAKLPRKTIRIEVARDHVWTISFGPQGSIAHALDGLELGVGDAHPSLPILRLAEVRAIARAWTGGDVPGSYVPLLLYPVAGLSIDELATARDDIHATRVEVASDLIIDSIETMPRAEWRKDSVLGWVTDGEDSLRNPRGVHYGSAWRELAETSGDPRHREQADALAASGWKADREFARIAAFFDEIARP